MSHQSDWSYYKQPIKLPLDKVNHVCGDFILILILGVGSHVMVRVVKLIIKLQYRAGLFENRLKLIHD